MDQTGVTVTVKSTEPSSVVLAVSWRGRSNGQGPAGGGDPGPPIRDYRPFRFEVFTSLTIETQSLSGLMQSLRSTLTAGL